MELGDFVRHRRVASDLTQRQLGELAGVGTRFVSELERGKPTLRLDSVNRVLAVFGKRLGVIDASRGIPNASPGGEGGSEWDERGS